MTWPAIFVATNAIALAGWAGLAFLPRRPAIHSLILYAGVALLCLAYAAMFVALFGGLADPGRVPGTGEPDLADYSISGLRALFMSDGGIVLGWTHYLAFDLFVGCHIFLDARTRGLSHALVVPCLCITLLVGPLGLLAYHLARRLWPPARVT